MLPPTGSRVVVHVVDFDRFYDRLGRDNSEQSARELYESHHQAFDGKIATVIGSFHDVHVKSDVVRLRLDGSKVDTALYAEDVILERIIIEEDFL